MHANTSDLDRTVQKPRGKKRDQKQFGISGFETVDWRKFRAYRCDACDDACLNRLDSPAERSRLCWPCVEIEREAELTEQKALAVGDD